MRSTHVGSRFVPNRQVLDPVTISLMRTAPESYVEGIFKRSRKDGSSRRNRRDEQNSRPSRLFDHSITCRDRAQRVIDCNLRLAIGHGEINLEQRGPKYLIRNHCQKLTCCSLASPLCSHPAAIYAARIPSRTGYTASFRDPS